MIKTEKDDCFKQLKHINNLLKDESFLYPYKETIENFFSGDGAWLQYKKNWRNKYGWLENSSRSPLVKTGARKIYVYYNLRTKDIKLSVLSSDSGPLGSTIYFDNVLVGAFTFQDFVFRFKDKNLITPNERYGHRRLDGTIESPFNVDIDSIIKNMYSSILKDYKRNLKKLLDGEGVGLKFSSKFKEAEVFPFQFYVEFEEKMRIFEFNSYKFLNEHKSLKDEAKHLEYIYEEYKDYGLKNIQSADFNFSKLRVYCEKFSLNLDDKIETYSETLFGIEKRNYSKNNKRYEKNNLFKAFADSVSMFKTTNSGEYSVDVLSNYCARFIQECQTSKTDLDLLGTRSFDNSSDVVREGIFENLASKFDDNFVLNVDVMNGMFFNSNNFAIETDLNRSLGALLDSGVKVKIRLIYSSLQNEFRCLVSKEQNSNKFFEWLENLDDDKKKLVSFHKNEVESVKVLLENNILETGNKNIIQLLES